MKKILLALALFIPSIALAVQITVPSAPSSGYGLISTTTGQYISTTTGVVTCSGTASCGAGSYVFGNALTISGSGQASISTTWPIILTGATISFGGLSTSTTAVVGNIPYFSGVNTFANVATSTPQLSGGLSYSGGTLGSFVGGSAGTLTIGTNALALSQLPQINANTFCGNPTGATANITCTTATSSFFAAGTPGNVLTYTAAGTWVPSATTTFANGTGITTSLSGNVLTITNSGVISNSCPGGFLTCSGTNPSSFSLGTLGIANGGTGTTTNRYGGIFFGDGSIFRQASSTALLDYDPTTQIFTAKNASTTNLSVLTQAVFGSTASSSFSSAGVLTLASALAIGSGGTASTTGGYTNGVIFYDGTSHTNDQAITHQKGANTGIGTTTPTSQLAVSTSTQSANTTPLFTVASTTNDTIITTLGGGQTGIGTTSPFSSLTLGRNGAIASSSILVFGYTPATSTTMNVDCRDSNTIHISNGTSALTITLKTMLFGQTCSVIVSNSGGTPGTVTWTAAANQPLYWNAGTAPTQTTTAYKRDVYSFKADLMSASATSTPGVSILGMYAQNF